MCHLVAFIVITVLHVCYASVEGPGDAWLYKFAFTKQINAQLVIDCGQSDQIWIGWSHYGTRHASVNSKKERTHALLSDSAKYLVNL